MRSPTVPDLNSSDDDERYNKVDGDEGWRGEVNSLEKTLDTLGLEVLYKSLIKPTTFSGASCKAPGTRAGREGRSRDRSSPPQPSSQQGGEGKRSARPGRRCKGEKKGPQVSRVLSSCPFHYLAHYLRLAGTTGGSTRTGGSKRSYLKLGKLADHDT